MLPKDLNFLTPGEIQRSVDYLSTLPLTELRKRQNLNVQQINLAFDQRNDAALINLQIMANHLLMAVDKKEFKDT
jgi:hypothetical protein